MSVRFPGCWVALTALFCMSAQAAEAPVVVYAGVPASDEGRDQAAALLSVTAPEHVGDVPVHLGDVLASDGLSAWNLQDAQPCTGDPVTAADYDAVFDELVMAYRMVESTDALARQLRSQWSCLTSPVAPADLARVPLYEALGAAAEDRLDDASVAFREALVLSPAEDWGVDLDPVATTCVGAARSVLSESPAVRLRIWTASTAEAWVDGQRVASPWDGVEVPPGTHIVQVRRTPAGPLIGLTVTTRSRGDALVVDRSDLAGGQDPDIPGRTIELFTALHGSDTPAPELLVLLGGVPAVIRADGTLAMARQRTNRSLRAGGALLGVGAAVAVTGTVLYATGMSKHQAWMDEYEGNATPEWWDQNVDQEHQNFDLMYAGGGLAIAGAVTAAIGIPLLIDGAKRKRDQDPDRSANVVVSPGPAAVAITVEF